MRFSIFIYLFLLNFLNAQQKDNLIIKGTINFPYKNDTISLSSGLGEIIDLKEPLIFKKSKINNGKFEFSCTIKHPQDFSLWLKGDDHSSHYFYLSEGLNEIELNKDYNVVVKNSGIEHEYQMMRKLFIDRLYKKVSESQSNEELHENQIKRDSLFVEYVKNNPNSYVALCELAQNYPEGITKFTKKALSFFSPEIKKTNIFKMLEKRVIETENLTFIQEIALKDINLKTISFNIKNFHSKYTLIDYWFSYCHPCVQSIPSLKNLFNKYEQKGFQIISISIDSKKAIPNWLKIINKKEMNWVQFLDENGKFSTKYGIAKFPTYILLDSDGKIINRDISIKEIEKFLEDNMKN